jgi:type IV fimbrial biogenesis protein FimT
MNPTRDARGTRGFGVVEAMITISLISILAGVSAASFSGVTRRTRVTADASDLLHAIELARAEAMKRQARVTIAPVDANTWTSGWIVFLDSNANRRWDADEPLLLRHRALATTTTLVTDTTPGYVAFGSQGRPIQYTGAFLAGTIAFCDGRVAKSVVIAKSGRPRLQSGTC